MALYVRRPRRDEVRIGRGLPSGSKVASSSPVIESEDWGPESYIANDRKYSKFFMHEKLRTVWT